MTMHAAATEGDKTAIVCPGCDGGRGCSHCGYRGWVWHYLTECPICHSAVSVVNGEAELCECQKQGDGDREEGVADHLAALRRDLERPGRVGLYLAGISAALTAIVREHPDMAPLITRQAERWHDALTMDSAAPAGHRFQAKE